MFSDILFIFISILSAGLGYLATDMIIFPIAIFLVFMLYYFIFGRKLLVNYHDKQQRIHACYHFINSFIISMSVKESVEDAYQAGIRSPNKELNEITNELTQMNAYDRIIYLRDYFNLGVYKMFINVLDLYQDQGGNILNMSEELISESTRIENVLTESTSISSKYLGEILLLWILSFGILVFLRFSIAQFYNQMKTIPIFLMFIGLFFVILLFSIHLFITRFTTIQVKEDKMDE